MKASENPPEKIHFNEELDPPSGGGGERLSTKQRNESRASTSEQRTPTCQAYKETKAQRGGLALPVSHSRGPGHLTSKAKALGVRGDNKEVRLSGCASRWQEQRRPVGETLEDLGPVLGGMGVTLCPCSLVSHPPLSSVTCSSLPAWL